MKKILLVFILGTLGCKNENEPNITTTNMVIDTTKSTEAAVAYDYKLVDNKKDPICGMPVKAGISDTVHYKNKVYGFCAAECKAEFVKSPQQYLADLK